MHRIKEMDFKLYVLWLMVSLTYSFEHEIIISKELQSAHAQCDKVNKTLYKCSSLSQALQLLSVCCNSTDVFVEPGNYTLNASFTFTYLMDIQLHSDRNSIPAEIQCIPNINNTGLAFIGVRNLSIEHLKITGCGMQHTSSIYFKNEFIVLQSALFIQNSSDIFISNVTFFDNNGTGLMILDTNGTVGIVDSLFISNKLKVVNKRIAGGGGIYIEFTNCTPGLHSCDLQSSTHNGQSVYTVDQCRFENNSALYNYSENEPDRLTSNVHISFGAGGGLSVQFHGSAYNNTFSLSNSLFDSNEANSGGGLGVDAKQNSTGNFVVISNTVFNKNSAHMYQGGGGAHMGVAIYQTNENSFNNSYIVVNCTFEHNQALLGVGGGITWYASHEPGKPKATNRFEVHNSNFTNNEAQYGSAIQINKEYHATVTEGSILALIIDGCVFIENNLQSIRLTTSFDSVGAVSVSGVDVQFVNHNRFNRNNSTALVVDGAAAEFFNYSYTEFHNNMGLHGGAVLLIGDSWMQAHPNSTLLFQGNTALTYGGAIYVELSTPYEFVLSHSCFIRYYHDNVLPYKWNTSFIFINNTSHQVKGNAIFANTLRPCLKSYVDDTSQNSTIFLYVKPFYYPNITGNISYVIMTSPVLFNFPNCNDTSFDIIPGEVHDLQVHLVDELNQSITHVTFIASCFTTYRFSNSPKVMPLYTFTNGLIQIAGNPTDTCQLQLKTDSDYQATRVLNVTLVNCPPGFAFDNEILQCKCLANDTYSNPVIKSCETATFQTHYNPFYWVGYESDNATNLLFGACPYRYCYTDHTSQNQLLPQNADKAALDKYVCGNRNRTGLLCGECVKGHSVAMNSPTFSCYRCKTHHFRLGVLYLLLSYIIPVTILFVAIMTYNIRMTYGTFSAFLFYSQIISSQYHRNLDYFLNVDSPTTLSVSDALLTIYSISNLEFFQHELFSYCLFEKAGTVDVLGFKALLSLYPVLLITVYFVLRRMQYYGLLCRRPSVCSRLYLRLPTNSVTHGICAFLVLSYAKVSIIAFTILKSADISRMDATLSNIETVVYMQGNTKYFDDTVYNVYAIGSLLLIVTLIVLPAVILMLYPIIANIVIICGWQESRGIQIVNRCLFVHRLKPILDSFQGDYQHHLRFFSGLHFFLYRSLFFCIVVAGSTPDIKILFIFILVFFFLIAMVHMLTMPFNKYIDNAAYSLIYMLMLALWTMEYFLLSSEKLSYTIMLLWFKIFLSSLPLCVFVSYCILKLLSKLWQYYNRRSDRDESLHTFPDRLINDDDDDDDNNDESDDEDDE